MKQENKEKVETRSAARPKARENGAFTAHFSRASEELCESSIWNLEGAWGERGPVSNHLRRCVRARAPGGPLCVFEANQPLALDAPARRHLDEPICALCVVVKCSSAPAQSLALGDWRWMWFPFPPLPLNAFPSHQRRAGSSATARVGPLPPRCQSAL